LKFYLIISVISVLAVSVQPTHAQLQWQFAEPMPTARSNAAAAVLDGQIYVIGGRDDLGNVLDVVERYDPVNNTWHPVSALRRERAGAAAAIFQDKLYVLGGHRFSSDDGDRNVLSDVEVFDQTLDRWDSFAGLEENRDALAAVVLNGTFYALGGADDNGGALATVEFYDPVDGEWRLEDGTGESWILDIARVSFATATVADAAYTFGGFGSFSGPVSQAEKFQSTSGTTILPPFSTPRGGLSAEAVGNAVFVMGGRKQDDAVTDRVDMFLTTSNVWETLVPMNTSREDLASATVSNVVYVFGGRDERGFVIGSVEQYGPVDVAVQRTELPVDFDLGTAHPNPFRTRTIIPLEVSAQASSQNVTLVIFDVLGREVKRLIDGTYPVGSHELVWDATDTSGQSVASGTYMYRLSQGTHSLSSTLVLIR